MNLRDKKSEIQRDSNKLTLTVRSENNDSVAYKLRKTTKMGTLMRKHCQKKFPGVTPDRLRFLFDGERIKDTDTPESLEMQDQDEIDVVQEQVGGNWSILKEVEDCSLEEVLFLADLVNMFQQLDEKLEKSLKLYDSVLC